MHLNPSRRRYRRLFAGSEQRRAVRSSGAWVEAARGSGGALLGKAGVGAGAGTAYAQSRRRALARASSERARVYIFESK